VKKSITISAQKRPQHLKETLEALKRCDGIEEWGMPMVLIDYYHKQQECFEVAARSGFMVTTFGSKLGCNRMIKESMNHGFWNNASDFHVHFEDDTVPTKGALRWFDWAMEKLKDQKVLSVLAYQRTPCGEDDQYVLQRNDLSWGWGTWKDRWAHKLSPNWLNKDGDMAWDTHVQQNVLKDWYVAQPCISRIQNTGSTDGTFCRDKHTYETAHRSQKTTDSIIKEFQLRASSS
jgi:hypothetical protein